MSKTPDRAGRGRLPGRPILALALLAVDLGLRLFGFARVRSWAGEGSRSVTPDREPSPGELELARALAGAVERAAGLRLYRVPCLARALVLRRLLAGRGIAGQLRIGVRRGERALHAHAWIVCGSHSLDPDPGVEDRFRGLE